MYAGAIILKSPTCNSITCNGRGGQNRVAALVEVMPETSTLEVEVA